MVDTFDSLKELGNKLFSETNRNGNLPPIIYQHRLCQALQFYNKAGNLAKSAQQVSSIGKNLALTQMRIAEKLNGLFRKMDRTNQQIVRDLQFYLQEALENFGKAIEIGQQVHGPDWIAQLNEKYRKCAKMLYAFLLASHKKDELTILRGRLHQLCWNLNGSIRAEMFLKLGRMTFIKAVQYQEGGKAIESLQLLRDNHLNIEEAKKLDAQLQEAVELEENNIMHSFIGESSIAMQRGDKLWREATCNEGNILMEPVFEAIDCYKQSIVLCRGKCLENEAIAHSQLGKLYESIVMNLKSREQYQLTVDLVVAMAPKNFNSHTWYKQALAGLNKFQQEQRWKETKEKERLRRPVLAELKDELDALKKASAKSPQELLDTIYAKYPPKRGDKSADSQMKKKLKMALLHYHPDKQDVEDHGLKWVVLTEEITLLLTYHFSC